MAFSSVPHHSDVFAVFVCLAVSDSVRAVDFRDQSMTARAVRATDHDQLMLFTPEGQ